ncbi:MAG: hypothetical protein U0840_26800 [Gemmataceae bacterium]
MTEQDWLDSNDPTAMLGRLKELGFSERKLRLLACACCRCIWEHLEDPRSRRAVEVAERYADGKATPRELADARASAVPPARGPSWAAYWATNIKASGPVVNVFEAAVAAAATKATRRTGQAITWDSVHAASVRDQVDLIREVAGNPYKEVHFDPRWLTWEGGQIVRFAEAVYESMEFDRMPILADALEEAGCSDETVLEHCRHGGPHVRGCWVLDLVLDKE